MERHIGYLKQDFAFLHLVVRQTCDPLWPVSQLIASKSNSTSLAVIITDENYCYTQKKNDSAPQFDGPDIAVMYKA